MLYKKADGGLTAIVIIVIILVFLGWLYNVGLRECNSNSDCSSDAYCGVEHNCHKIPVIEKSPVVVEKDLTKPAWILGIAIVAAAIVLKSEKIAKLFRRKKKTLNGEYVSLERL